MSEINVKKKKNQARKEGKMQGMSAYHKNAQMSARKISLAAKLIRNHSASKALDLLMFQRGKAAKIILKILKSAVANANNINKITLNELFVQEVEVGQGLCFARHLPRAKGRMDTIVHKRSNICIKLSKIENNNAKSAEESVESKKNTEENNG